MGPNGEPTGGALHDRLPHLKPTHLPTPSLPESPHVMPTWCDFTRSPSCHLIESSKRCSCSKTVVRQLRRHVVWDETCDHGSRCPS